MQKPALLRAIYAELRNGLGPDVPGSDLIKLANVILRAYTHDEEQLDYGTPAPNRSFASLPVDEAMRDGGWRVLEFESMRAFLIENLETEALTALRPLIEKFLGPEWRYQETPTSPP